MPIQELGQLEVKHGLLQLAETLNFFHNKAHILHCIFFLEMSIWNTQTCIIYVLIFCKFLVFLHKVAKLCDELV